MKLSEENPIDFLLYMIIIEDHIFGYLIHDLDVIFYTDPKDVKLVDDGERSTNTSFRDEIIELFEMIVSNKGLLSANVAWIYTN